MALGKPIGEILGNGIDRGITILNRSTIAEIVEPALITACEVLYDKNIETIDSSANIEDVERGYAGICIHYDTLSPENQRIADAYFGGRRVSGDGFGVTSIKVPVNNPDISCERISDLAIVEALKFESQPLTWARIFTPEDFFKLGFSEDDGYYDYENQVYFQSKEHYDKLKATPEVFEHMVTLAQMELEF